MGLLDQILGGMLGGQGRPGQSGGLGDVLGSVLGGGAQGQTGQGSGQGGLGDLLGSILGGGQGHQGQPGQPGSNAGASGGLGGQPSQAQAGGGLPLNPILMAVLAMLAGKAIGGMMNRGANAGQAAAGPADRSLGGEGSAGGLGDQFQRGGMGSAFDSWVGTGSNQQVSSNQLEQLMGKDAIADLARKLGVSEGEASRQAAEVLPDVVDRLTPNGQLPANGFGDVGSMLQQLLRGGTR